MKIDLRDVPVFYINLDRDVEKKKVIESTIDKCGFTESYRVPGGLHEKGIVGCSLGHLSALFKTNPPFIVLEDDAQIKNFVPVIEVPDNADAVYLCASRWGNLPNGRISSPIASKYEKVNEYDNVYRLLNMTATTAILYLSTDYVKHTLNVLYNNVVIYQDPHDIDLAVSMPNFNVYGLNSPMFYQDSKPLNKDSTFYDISEYKYDF